MSDTEQEFLERSRAQVVRYLDHFRVEYRAVAQEPAWFVDPFVSVWAVFGAHAAPGWFAISGDLPTDYVSSADARNARDAVRHFAREWSSDDSLWG